VGALRACLRYLHHAPPLHAVRVLLVIFIICGSALWALLPLVAVRDLNMGGLGYGIFLGCLGLGAIIGAVFLSRVRQRLSIDVLVACDTLVFTAATVALVVLLILCVVLLV